MPAGQKKPITPPPWKRNARRIGGIARRAGVPNFAGGRNSVPAGQKKPITPPPWKRNARRIGGIARRAGVPNFAGGRNPVPAGQQVFSIARPQGHKIPYRFTGINNSKGMAGFQSAGYSSKQGACSLSFQSPWAASQVWYMNMYPSPMFSRLGTTHRA